MSFVFAPPQQAVVPVQDETYSYFPIRRVFGIARNYAEPGAATKDTPFYFMKDCYTVVPVADGECARIPMPPQSQVLKHEIELVACLGKGRPQPHARTGGRGRLGLVRRHRLHAR